ncbi:MAG: peptidoglycan-associated lipoprotein Pal [Paucibacter sp.]|nr:peptidoglycan-associated lipoprotein Pal [Roseateles sp.]
MKTTRYALSVLALAAMAGCASKVDLDKPAPVETAQPVQTTPPPATPAPAPESKVATVDLGAELTKAVSDKRVVYFDFDSYVVKDSYAPLLDAHAKRMNNDRKVALRLEGNTDERGGSEYNLALGQKRSEAVAKSLEALGVQAGQVEPVSFGKERPAAEGHDEAAWSKNRRVELKDK